ncbi:MAG: HlyD family efflux transporter periplasmic adaptor subunit [Rhodospirillales bacterium]
MKSWIAVVALGLAVILAVGWLWLDSQSERLPEGFVETNGRIEAERIDVATKFAGRLQEVLVAEGDPVVSGQLIALMDATQIEAQLREAEAGVHQAEQGLIEAHALLTQRKSERTFAEQQLARAETLSQRGHTTRETVDLRRSQRATAVAAVASAEAGIGRAEATIEAAKATADRLRADLLEYALVAPRAGRVQYRLAEPGEVLAAGGLVVSLLDLTDVFMTIYLPTSAAGPLRYGAEARIVFDAAPQYVVPASVTFVAGEAQFTPKYVETESEREKLMFRVKVAIPKAVLEAYQETVKTGVPGMAYVRVDPTAVWPADLAVKLPDGG